MGDSNALQSLADAIGAASNHDIDIIAKTLSYLGISNSSVENGQQRCLFSISIDGSHETTLANFDPKLKQWHLVPRIVPTPEVAPSHIHDWTELLPKTSHVDFLKSRDWAATALGPMSSWSVPLQLMVMKMLSDPRPANLYVGPSKIAVYNEPFSIVAASRHPFMMASTCEAALPLTWPILSAVFEEIERTGEAFSAGSFEMGVEKVAGFLEE